MFGVTILGNNSAIPAFKRHPTAQIVTLNDQYFLIDCGEGTQSQISKYKVKRTKINHIFISHLHGDHYFGLIGLITSMGLMGRENDLYLFAPKGLDTLINLQLNLADTSLPFKIHFTAIENEGVLIENNKYIIECFATKHRIPCFGFVIREKKAPRKIIKEKVLKYEIPTAYYENLKQGKDYEKKDGTIISNHLLTSANSQPKSYAYSADTIYDEEIIEKIKNVSLLYHETTYLQDDEIKAKERFHSTSKQAATIALKANVKKLIIGHFSSKYEHLQAFEDQAKSIFANTELALEGVTFKI